MFTSKQVFINKIKPSKISSDVYRILKLMYFRDNRDRLRFSKLWMAFLKFIYFNQIFLLTTVEPINITSHE